MTNNEEEQFNADFERVAKVIFSILHKEHNEVVLSVLTSISCAISQRYKMTKEEYLGEVSRSWDSESIKYKD